jgi:serine/threonine-protein kinase
MRSDPATGSVLRRDAAVDLVVSRGPRPVRVEDYTGKHAETATRALRRAHLVVRSSAANSDTIPAGDVISQTPRTGRLLPHRTVRLVVSKGPVLVEVPRVLGKSAGSAQETLQLAGFSVRTEHVQYYIGLGVVVNASPGGGDRAPRGSTVTIYLV